MGDPTTRLAALDHDRSDCLLHCRLGSALTARSGTRTSLVRSPSVLDVLQRSFHYPTAELPTVFGFLSTPLDPYFGVTR